MLQARASAFLTPVRLAFIFLIPRLFTVFREWAQRSRMLVLYGTYGSRSEKKVRRTCLLD